MKSPKSAIFNQKTQHELKIPGKTQANLEKTQDFEPKTTCNGGSMPQYPSTLCRKKSLLYVHCPLHQLRVEKSTAESDFVSEVTLSLKNYGKSCLSFSFHMS